MSFLAGRLAGKEAAYFFQESKHAVNRLAEKPTTKTTGNDPPTTADETLGAADVLPEILRHSLPTKIFGKPLDSSSLVTSSKWALPYDPSKVSMASPDVLNPLTAYLSLPQVTFGPKRWKLASENHRVVASTANEKRKDRSHSHISINLAKVEAAAQGLTQIGHALAIGTAIVFGGATLVFALAASKVQLHNGGDIRSRVKEVVQPRFEMIHQQLVPLKIWVEETSKEWRVHRQENLKEKPIVKELSKHFNVKISN